MATATIKINSYRFAKAMEDFMRYSRRDFGLVLKEQAKGFIRRVISVTPPSQGKADSESRKRGEQAVYSDLYRIFDPAKKNVEYDNLLQRGSMESWHKTRRGRNGRVWRTVDRKKDVARVSKSDFQWFRKEVQKKVGILASGWNRAAESLGYNPPEWIRRHGTGRGDYQPRLSGDNMRITIRNEVKFAGSTQGLKRQVQWAIDTQAEAMERRVAFFLKRNARRAGMRAR